MAGADHALSPFPGSFRVTFSGLVDVQLVSHARTHFELAHGLGTDAADVSLIVMTADLDTSLAQTVTTLRVLKYERIECTASIDS